MTADDGRVEKDTIVGKRVFEVLKLAQEVVTLLSAKGLYITTVESCTGGALASAITDISGSSEVLKDSFITYSNEAKIVLGVPEALITKYTVYSLEVAEAMAQAGLKKSVHADIAVGITGSLTRVDPVNKNSIPGQVYLSVVTDTAKVSLPLVIAEHDRVGSKLRVVEHALGAVKGLVS